MKRYSISELMEQWIRLNDYITKVRDDDEKYRYFMGFRERNRPLPMKLSYEEL